ncbi:MAG: hypothetical protein LBD57_04480 [Endomicrobium sp.]|jgi:predicted transcriptional regulator|uniref:helix-turn-helix domain-containing protein n=1 Tax=Candidatus Endomicrobiellum cubanum TaxID=3242325 RepID=UPI002832F819|nr:hypothetical protein [Endomicrobium sp.]
MTYLIHYGTKRHSGRYPWGSGDNPQRSKNFKTYVNKLREKGMTETDIARALGLTTSTYRARLSSENTIIKLDTIAQVQKLKDKGYSDKAIANRLRLSEKTVNNYLKPETLVKLKASTAALDVLKSVVDNRGMTDVGTGSEQQIGVSRTKMKHYLEQLKQEGYVVRPIYEDQLGNPGKQTPILVLAKPGTTYKEIYNNRAEIKPIIEIHTSDGGETWSYLRDVELVNPDRIAVNYKEDGGTNKDGVIELRRGVPDLDLGNKIQAQVRIAVEGDKYLKGMAMYANDLPDGIDIRFNTNKSKIDADGNSVSKLDTMKSFKKDLDGNIDLTNPFGSTIKAAGQRGALNIINEESDWDEWNNKNHLSSQFLSKQSPELAKRQLDLAYKIKEDDYNEILSLTNPVIKKDLLMSFADKADSDALELRAASLPRQANKVLLPIPELKENEVYTTTFKNGEHLVLIRHPHGGIFEIPEVVVNNNNRKAKELLGNSIDAIGVNPKVAQKLSGADFDGDNVLVIPNRKGTKYEINTAPMLQELQDFDPKEKYSVPPSMLYDKETNPGGFKPMDKRTRGLEMGKVSNLITDMTIKGATTQDEIIRAVKHSMTVIDAEKHKLNWKQSYQDNNIADLHLTYQGKKSGGAATLISRAKSRIDVLDRKDSVIDLNTGKRIYIDPKTGKKLYTLTGATKKVFKKDPITGKSVLVGEKPKKIISKRMKETDDAYTLSSGTKMEGVYADHANRLKALANKARLEVLKVPNLEYSPSANKAYATEVKSLKAQLKLAKGNKAYERQATLISNAMYNAKKAANPNFDADDLSKLRGQCLTLARARVGAKKHKIEISDNEWNAIQSGAISNYLLTQIVANSNKENLIRRALPKSSPVMSSGKISRARSMMARGYTRADIADMMGVSVSTLNAALK